MKTKRHLSPFVRTALHVEEERQLSETGERTDKKRISQTREGRLLSFLRYLGFIGGMVYCFIALRMVPSVTWYGSVVVEDHAAGIIRRALQRVSADPSVPVRLRTRRPSRLVYIRVLLIEVPTIIRGFRKIPAHNVVAFVRFWKFAFLYLSARALFLRNKPSAVFLARTSDLKRLAVGAAADTVSVPIATFTVERVGLRRHAPYRVDTVFCWTATQARYYADRARSVVQMPVPVYRGIITIPEPATKVGMLLNAKCDVEKIGVFLLLLKDRFGIQSVLVRPHPGFDLRRLDGLSNAQISDWREPLDRFLDQVDVVFALNTNAIIEALLHGVPVVFVDGLDRAGYDVHGFVATGIVLPFDTLVSFPFDINEFYRSDDFHARWGFGEFQTDGNAEVQAIHRLLRL